MLMFIIFYYYFRNYPTACLEQKTSRLKGNVQVYRYFNTKNKPQKKEYFKKQYQAVWSARGQRYVSLMTFNNVKSLIVQNRLFLL